MIDVVIATYNGEDFIKEQLDSILKCDLFEQYISKVIVSDDSSSLKTKEIVNSYGNKFLYVENLKNKGVITNFDNAVKYTTSDYVMFSDQDDIWLKNKIDILYKGIVSIEKNKPALFFSDLTVVDEKCEIIHESFWKYQNINPESVYSVGSISIQNVSPGCVMICNRKLLDICYPYPNNILMHDWWMIILATVIGNVGYSEQSTHLYRQHSNNVLGAPNMNIFWKLKKLKTIIDRSDSTFEKTIIQAKEIKKRLQINGYEDDIINIISSLGEDGFISDFKKLIANNIKGSSFFRSNILYLKVLSLYIK